MKNMLGQSVCPKWWGRKRQKTEPVLGKFHSLITFLFLTQSKSWLQAQKGRSILHKKLQTNLPDISGYFQQNSSNVHPLYALQQYDTRYHVLVSYACFRANNFIIFDSIKQLVTCMERSLNSTQETANRYLSHISPPLPYALQQQLTTLVIMYQ